MTFRKTYSVNRKYLLTTKDELTKSVGTALLHILCFPSHSLLPKNGGGV